MTLLRNSGKSYAKRVVLSASAATSASENTFLMRPLIGADLETHAPRGFCRHLSDEACFLYKFRDRNFLFASMHGLAVRPETLTGEAEALRYDYYLAKYSEGILELPDRRGLHFVIDETAKTNPKAAGQTPESLKLLEPAVLDELKKSGFVERAKK